MDHCGLINQLLNAPPPPLPISKFSPSIHIQKNTHYQTFACIFGSPPLHVADLLVSYVAPVISLPITKHNQTLR